jgi:hypothetical protein
MSFYPAEFILKYTLTSSDITTGKQALSVNANTGDLYIRDIVVKTDSTGLATGTNFVISSNNAKGLANILVESVANLGGNKTVNLATASVTKQATVLEAGKHLEFSSTALACTGGGTVDIYVYCQRATVNANLFN